MEEAFKCENDFLAESMPPPTTKPDEPHTLSYQEVQDLISAGRLDEIPFNKKIPEALNVRRNKSPVDLAFTTHNLSCRKHRLANQWPHGGGSLGKVRRRSGRKGRSLNECA